MGAGDPDHLTLAAIKAMRRAQVFFVLGKGREKESLTRLRRDILAEHLTGPYRVVEAEDPWRDRTQDDRGRYTSAVHDWRHRRADICERLIIEELAPGSAGRSWSGATRPCTTAPWRSWRTSRTGERWNSVMR